MKLLLRFLVKPGLRSRRGLLLATLPVIAGIATVGIYSGLKITRETAEKKAHDLQVYKMSNAVSQKRKKKDAQIKRELGQLSNQEWAGSYYNGDGLGLNICLNFAPKSGFTYCLAGCTGICDQNYGSIQEGRAGLTLNFELPVDKEESNFSGVTQEMIPILWGERHYLVSKNKLLDFCNGINASRFLKPEPGRSLDFLLKDGDDKKFAKGMPKVPQEYQKYLLPHPVTAKIQQLRIPKRLFPFKDSKNPREIVVSLNVGQQEGILPGMTFYKPSVFQEAIVIRTDEHTCDAVFSGWDKSDPLPRVGETISTKDQ